MALKALFFILTIANIAFTNPFLIEVNKKEKLVVDDYLVIQSQLRSIDISSLISSYYQEFIHTGEADPNRFSCDSFYRRCSAGINWNFADPKQGRLPQKNFVRSTKEETVALSVFLLITSFILN